MKEYIYLHYKKVKADKKGFFSNMLAGSQVLVVAFGALVLVPLITGLDVSVALFTAGIGTLVFQLITKKKVPIFLASSFAFIAPISYAIATYGISSAMGALMATGLFYAVLSMGVKKFGVGFIDKFFPPIVVGPVIMVIGLGLAPTAVNMAIGKSGDGVSTLYPYEISLIVSMISLATTLLVSVFAKGFLKLLPIMSAIVVGFFVSFAFGIVDFTPFVKAAWFKVPNFVAPEFNIQAILFMLPVALAPAIEHIGDLITISNVTGKNYLKDPGLHKTLLGDGVATTLASSLGGPPNTTYSEVTGAVVLTKNFNPSIMTWGAIFAIILAFVEKLGAFLRLIPTPVMGGILVLLFGSIAVIGLNALVKSKQDLTETRNMVIISVTLIFGIGGMSIGSGEFSLKGISLCAISAVLLNALLPHPKKENQ